MMAGLDRRIDPDTKDYILDDTNGSWETTRSAETAVYHQVVGELGNWAGDPDAGSRFWELARGKSTLRTVAVIADILTECLAPLVNDGRISTPVISVEKDSRLPDRIAAETYVTDLATGDQLTLVDILPLDV